MSSVCARSTASSCWSICLPWSSLRRLSSRCSPTQSTGHMSASQAVLRGSALKPGCRLRLPYVPRSARQHDQRRQAVKKGTGTCRECLCPGCMLRRCVTSYARSRSRRSRAVDHHSHHVIIHVYKNPGDRLSELLGQQAFEHSGSLLPPAPSPSRPDSRLSARPSWTSSGHWRNATKSSLPVRETNHQLMNQLNRSSF